MQTWSFVLLLNLSNKLKLCASKPARTQSPKPLPASLETDIMLKTNNPLILSRGLQIPLACNAPPILGDNLAFINNLITTLGQLPANPPFEIHPYKQDFPLQAFEMYIIGTFPPISYILDKPPLVAAGITNLQQPIGAGGQVINFPWIPFYHGNQGSMWDFLLTPLEMAELTAIRNAANGRQNAKNYLINFLVQNKINYADIIETAQRTLSDQGRYDGKDNNLNNICLNKELICHILSNHNAKLLLFNTSSIFSNTGIPYDANGLVKAFNNNTKSFDLFIRQCQELGLEIKIRIQQGNPAIFYDWTNISLLTLVQRRTKIAFEIKIKNPISNRKLDCDFKSGEEKTFTVITPFSPAAVNRGRTRSNRIVRNWLLSNFGQTPSSLLTSVYQNFRNVILLPIYNLNV